MTGGVVERRHEWLGRARLYLVTEARPGGRDPEELVRAALQGGVDIAQLREKSGDDHAVVRAGRVFRRLCDAYDALFIVNDRPDLALAVSADGVHLGQDDMPVGQARQLVGPELLIGLSTHTGAQVDSARGVDYIGVGPVHETPTKEGRAAVGCELVAHASAHASGVFFAIGGINEATVASVVAAGAQRIAVVRALVDADDPTAVAEALRAALLAPARQLEAGVGAA